MTLAIIGTRVLTAGGYLNVHYRVTNIYKVSGKYANEWDFENFAEKGIQHKSCVLNNLS